MLANFISIPTLFFNLTHDEIQLQNSKQSIKCLELIDLKSLIPRENILGAWPLELYNSPKMASLYSI